MASSPGTACWAGGHRPHLLLQHKKGGWSCTPSSGLGPLPSRPAPSIAGQRVPPCSQPSAHFRMFPGRCLTPPLHNHTAHTLSLPAKGRAETACHCLAVTGGLLTSTASVTLTPCGLGTCIVLNLQLGSQGSAQQLAQGHNSPEQDVAPVSHGPGPAR